MKREKGRIKEWCIPYKTKGTKKHPCVSLPQTQHSPAFGQNGLNAGIKPRLGKMWRLRSKKERESHDNWWDLTWSALNAEWGDLHNKCRILGRWDPRFRKERENGKDKVEYTEQYLGIWEDTKNTGKVQKWSSSESFPKILKNHKYYKMIFSEIGFQKFNLLFKVKIIRSTVNLGIHRIGRVLIKSDKSQKMHLDRK